MNQPQTNQAQTVLIAGCGKLGCPLGSLLAKEGHQVFALRRNTSNIPADIDAICADLNQSNLQLPVEFDRVYYIVSAESRNDLAYYQAYVQGVKHLLSALEKQSTKQVKHFIFVSSTSVFGQTDQSEVTEDSPVTEHNFSSKRLLEGETLVKKSTIPSTTVRFGGIYGPGRTHLIDLISQGKGRCMDGVYSNRIHSEDCVGILKHLFDYPTPDSLYIGVDCQPTLTCEVYEWLAEQLSIAQIEYLEPSETARAMRSNKRLSNQRILSTGYQFKYPNYQSGYKDVLETYLTTPQ